MFDLRRLLIVRAAREDRTIFRLVARVENAGKLATFDAEARSVKAVTRPSIAAPKICTIEILVCFELQELLKWTIPQV